jgi:hypothetical protein
MSSRKEQTPSLRERTSPSREKRAALRKGAALVREKTTALREKTIAPNAGILLSKRKAPLSGKERLDFEKEIARANIRTQ